MFLQSIHQVCRHEKRCQMSVRLFSLFQGSRNQQWWPYFLPFLKDAENPFFDITSSEWNFTNILFPEDLIVFGNALPQSLFPNSGDAASLPSLTST